MFKYLLLLALVGCVAPQRSQFVDYILDLQYSVGFIHDYIQDTTWQARYDMSDELSLTIEGAVLEITNGLSAFIPVRDKIGSAVDAHRNAENGECVDAAAANWTQLQSTAGAAIAACGSQQLPVLHGQVDDFHRFVNGHRNVKFDAQNIVLSTFTRINPMTNFMDVTPAVEEGINEVYDFYEANVRPGIEERIGGFGTLRADIPGQVQTCVAAALTDFETQAGAMLQAVQAC